jgi:hypothetical protein
VAPILELEQVEKWLLEGVINEVYIYRVDVGGFEFVRALLPHISNISFVLRCPPSFEGNHPVLELVFILLGLFTQLLWFDISNFLNA